MALRRPPTRIDLKADDVEEYDKIMKERRIAAEQLAMREKMGHRQPGSDFDETPPSLVSSRKKPTAAERIGYRKSSR
ncbi:hypothetical protein ACHAXA_003105 [Cyclostephanos tholiformis]|uniref:Anaphase-promoting complex subunit CDC26 n=1 Tax=Cyclostephanos tholiformis TaxID=382380 RepID=A0ABD3SSJ8_9STRA